MVGLVKLRLPNKRAFEGKEFPVAFELTGDIQDVDKTLEFLKDKARKGFFNQLLSSHGVVVIRNSAKPDPETLSKYITAIGKNSNSQFFVQNGSTAKRREVTDILSTANEGPPEMNIHQHNEFSRFTKYPTTLFFVCEKYAATGGETPVVHGGELFKVINEKAPEFIKELSQRGLYMEQIWPLKSKNDTDWSYKFCFGRNIDSSDRDFEHQKSTALKLAKEIASPYSDYTADNDLRVRQYTNPIRVYSPHEGKSFPCFFNSIATFYANVKFKVGGYNKTKNICYNDGGFIPEEYLDLVLQSSIDLAYKHQWEEGDIVIVDNYMVSHGRCPWKGERKILVSMWDAIDKPDYAPWVGS